MSAPAVVFDLNKTGCGIARCLGRAGVPVTGVHTVPYPALGALSRYVHDPVLLPDAGDAEILAALESIADRYAAKPVVICATDRAVDFVSRRRTPLQLRFRLPGAAAPLHELLDKGVQAEIAARAGLSVPATVTVRRGCPDIARAIAGVPLPAIVKPGNSLFGYKRLMGIERTRDDLEARVAATLADCPSVVVSAYVPGGPEANFTVMALGRSDGSAAAATVTRKLRQLPQLAFGAGTLVEACRDDELVALAAAFVREARITGPVEVEFKREHGCGRPHFIEANLRCSALVEMTAAAGANLPYLAYLDALRDPLPEFSAERARVLWVDELRDWRLAAAGQLSQDELMRGYANVTMLSLHAADDPEPFEAARRDAMAEAGDGAPLLNRALERLLERATVTA